MIVSGSLVSGTAAWANRALVVDDDGAQCGRAAYRTIDAAIADAQSGDTIRVCPGVYRERAHVTEEIRIIGPVETVEQLDCFAPEPAERDDLDPTRFAVLEPPVDDEVAPVLVLDANGVELAGLVIQGVVDEVPVQDGVYSLFTPAVVATDSHSGYRLHHNVFRLNTFSVELGSDGNDRTRFTHNCLRENTYGVANQRESLANANVSDNASFRQQVITYEVGWGYRAARDVNVRDNDLREEGYGIFVENATRVRVSDNEVRSPSIAGIWVSAGNTDVAISDNTVEGGATLSDNPSGIVVTGPSVTESDQSAGIVVRDNAVSDIRKVAANGRVVGYGIVATFGALDRALIADNVAHGNGFGGITLFNNNRNNVLRDNLSYDNGTYGIRVQVALSTGNLLNDNRMYGNAIADASDASDQNPADGVQLLNTWRNNDCVTDDPIGTICGVG